MRFDPGNLFASILFGLIGFAAFRYGKNIASGRHLILGIALMGFPYLVSSLWAMYGTGTALTVLLFWP